MRSPAPLTKRQAAAAALLTEMIRLSDADPEDLLAIGTSGLDVAGFLRATAERELAADAAAGCVSYDGPAMLAIAIGAD